jgi:hypothetical protein
LNVSANALGFLSVRALGRRFRPGRFPGRRPSHREAHATEKESDMDEMQHVCLHTEPCTCGRPKPSRSNEDLARRATRAAQLGADTPEDQLDDEALELRPDLVPAWMNGGKLLAKWGIGPQRQRGYRMRNGAPANVRVAASRATAEGR